MVFDRSSGKRKKKLKLIRHSLEELKLQSLEQLRKKLYLYIKQERSHEHAKSEFV